MTKTTTKVVNTVSRCRCRNWETGAGILRHLPIAYLVRGDPELQGSQCSWLHTQGSSAASHWNKLRISRQAFPGGPVVKNLPWRRRGYGFHPWSGKIPHAAGQLCPCATAAEPLSCSHWSLHILEPVLCHKRSHGDEKHEHGGWRVFPPPPRPPPPATTRGKPEQQWRANTARKEYRKKEFPDGVQTIKPRAEPFWTQDLMCLHGSHKALLSWHNAFPKHRSSWVSGDPGSASYVSMVQLVHMPQSKNC